MSINTKLAQILSQDQLELFRKELKGSRPALRIEIGVPAKAIVPAYHDPTATMLLRFALLVNTTTGQKAYVCKQLGQTLTLESVTPALRDHGVAG